MASAATTTTTTSSANGSIPGNPSSSSQDSPMDNPLFLHHAKNPSLVLVTQPLIGGENYLAWARAVRKASRGRLCSPRTNWDLLMGLLLSHHH